MKAMGHTDIKTTMIYVSLGKSHIREQVEKLNTISAPTSAYQAQTRSQCIFFG
jgi:hypothetical protein